jgi:CRP/FNR family transcriptional regulator
MSREEMALLVGTTRETLSRSLHRLADRGVVSLGNGTVRILDRSILEQLSE